jgi:hypothetical protein
MDQSTQSTESSLMEDTPDDAVTATTTEVLLAIRAHYAPASSTSPSLTYKGQTKQKDTPAVLSPTSSSEGPLEKNAAHNCEVRGTAHDKMDKVKEKFGIDVNGDTPMNNAGSLKSPSSKRSLRKKAMPSSDGPAVSKTETNPSFKQQRRLHIPYASKLRSRYNNRNTAVISGDSYIERITDNHESNNESQDSFRTVAPPTLRPAATPDVTAPGATAVYPNDPVRQHASANMDQSGITNNMEQSENSSRSLNIGSGIFVSDAAPLIMARLVRDSEILPKHRHNTGSHLSGETVTRLNDNEDMESGRTGTSPSLGDVTRSNPNNNITQAVQVVKEDVIIGHRRKCLSLVRDRRVIAVLMLLMMTIVGLIVGLTLQQRRRNDELDGSKVFGNQTLFLSPAIIAENEVIVNDVLADLPILSTGPIHTPGSPQRVALNWLVNNNVLKNMDRFRIIQRYVLTVLYFSTGGLNNWLNHTGWISHDHECTWFQTDYFVAGSREPVTRCSDDGTIHALALENNGLGGTLPPGIGLLSDLGTFLRCVLAVLGILV